MVHPPQQFDLPGVVDIVGGDAMDPPDHLCVEAPGWSRRNRFAKSGVQLLEHCDIRSPRGFGRPSRWRGPVASPAGEGCGADEFVQHHLLPIGGVEELLPDGFSTAWALDRGRCMDAAKRGHQIRAVPAGAVEAAVEDIEQKSSGRIGWRARHGGKIPREIGDSLVPRPSDYPRQFCP